ncbi:serine/threonine-protein kinase [Sphaerisporangium aureirubrum]|uniref:Serine/threonine-protein kinase n=1 Tax=Sphaerisporangium aureirubrum TaxID=1544736 RepID=A0ABW1NLF4_9ACTN
MEPGEMLQGRYRLVAPLGKGGMAEVWKADDAEYDRLVAIKMVRPANELGDYLDTADHFRDRAELHGRFRREGALLRALDHSGIPTWYGQGNHGDRPFIVMEFVEGAPLNRWHERHRVLSPTVAVAVATQIADALQCAHEAPLVHRDLKPQNVLLASNGTAVLIDFGIAMPLRPDATRYTFNGATLGSRGYMAPEQILGRQVTPKTDLYAFGCLFYELLTGRPPFIAQGERGMTEQHLNDAPLPVQVFSPKVPDVVAALVERLLEKDPHRRPTHASAITEALRPFLPEAGSSAPSPRLNPDPTQMFRDPLDQSRRSPDGPEPSDRRPPTGRPGRRRDWVSSASIVADLAAVERELAAGEPGPVVPRLVALLPGARGQLGFTLTIQKARMRCADGLQIMCAFGQARELYEQMIADPGPADDGELQAMCLIARLGVGQCRIPFGETETALDDLEEVVIAVHKLPVEARKPVVARCEELALELSELGLKALAEALLARLPPP